MRAKARTIESSFSGVIHFLSCLSKPDLLLDVAGSFRDQRTM
jgi:hypothetical protein